MRKMNTMKNSVVFHSLGVDATFFDITVSGHCVCVLAAVRSGVSKWYCHRKLYKHSYTNVYMCMVLFCKRKECLSMCLYL